MTKKKAFFRKRKLSKETSQIFHILPGFKTSHPVVLKTKKYYN